MSWDQHIKIGFLAFLSVAIFGCTSTTKQETPSASASTPAYHSPERNVAASPVKFDLPGPAQPADNLELSNFRGKTYWSFAQAAKVAIDRDFPESRKIASALSRQGRDQILRQGGGVYVRLDSQNYTVHLGYVETTANGGENSGRSYGVGPSRNRKAADLSYPDLFDDLQEYFEKHENNPDMVAQFYRTFFEIVMKCDSSGLTRLDDEGQTLLTDIMSIYHAEANRNLMAKKIGLDKFDWQKHLGDVMMLAAFHAGSGFAFSADGEKLVEGPLSVFIGHGSEGSGVGGKGGILRRKFQSRLSSLMAKSFSNNVNSIYSAAGSKSSLFKRDLFHGMMEYINADQVQNADQLISAYVGLMAQLRTNATALVSTINKMPIDKLKANSLWDNKK